MQRGQAREVEPAGAGFRDGAERPDLRRRQAGLAEFWFARPRDRLRGQVGEGLLEARPDRRRAGDRQLLADDDPRQPRENRQAARRRRPTSPASRITAFRRRSTCAQVRQPALAIVERRWVAVDIPGGFRGATPAANRSLPMDQGEQAPCRPFSASRRRRPATCISATPFGAARFRPLPASRRAFPAPHRGHRRNALPAGIRGRDLRRPPLAGPDLGGAGPAPVRAHGRLPRGPRSPGRDGPSLSRLHDARGCRRGGHGDAWPRDPDGAPLYPGTDRDLDPDEAAARDRGRCSIFAAPAHGRRGRPPPGRSPGSRKAPGRAAKTGALPRRRPRGATWCSRARRRRPAITCRWWSTTRCRA